MKINHSNTGHACDQCKHVAYSLSDLTRHKLIHRPIEVRHTFLCTFCPKTFTSRPGLKYHRQWHEANPNEIWGRKKRKKTTKTTKTTMRTTSKKKSLKKKKKKTSTGGGSRSRINKKARLE